MTEDSYDPCRNVECPITDCEPVNECVLGRCVSEKRPEGYPCDDGNNATAFDTCVSGTCVGMEHHTTVPYYKLDELDAGRSYSIEVRAHTVVGAGPWSHELRAKTNETPPAAPPQNVEVEATSSTSVVLRWQPPPLQLQNGPVRGYEV